MAGYCACFDKGSLRPGCVLPWIVPTRRRPTSGTTIRHISRNTAGTFCSREERCLIRFQWRHRADPHYAGHPFVEDGLRVSSLKSAAEKSTVLRLMAFVLWRLIVPCETNRNDTCIASAFFPAPNRQVCCCCRGWKALSRLCISV
jgi:hypothetical protein